MGKEVEGMRVEVMVSDPWDFGTACGVGPFFGSIVNTGTIVPTEGWSGELAALVKLDEPPVFDSKVSEYLLASPRHKGHQINELSRGETLSCSMLRIPAERVTSANPFDVNWWRGGSDALIGSVAPARKQTPG